MTAFKGATAFEFQVGRLWMKFLRPSFWCRRNIRRFIMFGI